MQPETSFVFTTKLPDTCPSSGQNIIKHLNYDYSETSMVQHHRDLHSSIAGLPTSLASRGRTVTDNLVDVSGCDHLKVQKWCKCCLCLYLSHNIATQPLLSWPELAW